MKKILFSAVVMIGLSLGFVSCHSNEDETVTPTAPMSVNYSPTNVFSTGFAIPVLTPRITGGAATTYSVSPALPAGLTLNTSTGAISGTPTTVTAAGTYIVTAANSAGSTTTSFGITVGNYGPMLYIRFKFDKDQLRLNNLGQPSVVAAGNAAQSPTFNTISSHYVELAQTAYTQLGAGAVLYHAPETTAGGSNAIDFSQSKIVAQDETFLAIPLSSIASGSYEWVRVSLSYQNYDIAVRTNNVDYTGTLASFVGFNTYVSTYSVAGHPFVENANKLQGYWGFGMTNPAYASEGQAPAGATTVPNPLASTSPIPAGSCVVTGKFASNLVVTHSETQNVMMTLSLSINKSFEWHEVLADGKYDPTSGEYVVDMGLRGLIPSWSAQ